MHRLNNAVIMQTEQLGRIEALEEELRSSRGKVADLEQRMMEQDQVIAQLVGDNLDHLQDNMRLTAHINSSTERMAQMKRCTQKWDRRDEQGASSEAINVSRQLIGVVGTGLYHSMAEVQATVGQTVDPV